MSKTAALPKRSRSHFYIPWIVFSLTLFFSFIAWLVAEGLASQRDRDRFEEIHTELQNSIVESIQSQIDLGRSAAAFLGAESIPTDSQFADFLRRQNWPDPSSKFGAIGFLLDVKAGQGQNFITFAKHHGITKIHVDPRREGIDRALSLYRQPPSAQPAGVDISALPDRRESIWLARDSGQPTATVPLILIQDQKLAKKENSEIVFIPVYRTAKTPGDKSARRKSIMGYVAAGIRVGNLVRKSLPKDSEQPYVDLSIVSDSGKSESLFSNRPPSVKSLYSFHDTRPLFQRNWVFTYYSSPAFDAASGGHLTQLILGGGLFFGLILFFLTHRQLRFQDDLAEYAQEIEKKAAAESLLAKAGTLFSSSDDYRKILEEIGKAAVPSLADLCSIELLEDGKIVEVVVHCAHRAQFDASLKVSSQSPITLEDNFGIGKVLRTGRSELIESVESMLANMAGLDPAYREFFDATGFLSAMIVPITVRGQVFGAITFLSGADKPSYNSADLRQVEEIADRIGLSVDNSRLFQAAQRELEEKIKAESALKDLNDRLELLVQARTRELSVAVEELEAFCYSVSHDLRGPLRSVDGFSKALIDDYQSQIDPDGLDFLNRIRASAKRMDELITAMLTLSRLSRADISPEDVDLSAAALSVIDDHLSNPGVTFKVAPNLSTYADPHMVGILLDNLISNAVKFSSKTAHPIVEVGRRDDGVFYVKDNGAGFDPRYSNKLFLPFERLHSPREFPGTGIGLATVWRVIKRHGGRIWAESTPGNGATFLFSFGEPQSIDSLTPVAALQSSVEES